MEIRATLEEVQEGLEKLETIGSVETLDGTEGRVSVNGVEAHFIFEDDILTIKIIDKPFFISESYIEGEIKKYFNN